MRYSRIGGHYYSDDQVRQAVRDILPLVLGGVGLGLRIAYMRDQAERERFARESAAVRAHRSPARESGAAGGEFTREDADAAIQYMRDHHEEMRDLDADAIWERARDHALKVRYRR
jgi:hypothetical protein